MIRVLGFLGVFVAAVLIGMGIIAVMAGAIDDDPADVAPIELSTTSTSTTTTTEPTSPATSSTVASSTSTTTTSAPGVPSSPEAAESLPVIVLSRLPRKLSLVRPLRLNRPTLQ